MNATRSLTALCLCLTLALTACGDGAMAPWASAPRANPRTTAAPPPTTVATAPTEDPGAPMCCLESKDGNIYRYWEIEDGVCARGVLTRSAQCEEVCCSWSEGATLAYSSQIRAICDGNAGLLDAGDVVPNGFCASDAAAPTPALTKPTTGTSRHSSGGGAHSMTRPGSTSATTTRGTSRTGSRPSSGGMTRPRS